MPVPSIREQEGKFIVLLHFAQFLTCGWAGIAYFHSAPQISPPMIKALAHVCLLSRDLERTLDFYCGTLGLRKKFDFIRKGELFGFYLEVAPGQFIEVFKGDTAAEPQSRRITHFCLEVDDIGVVREKLASRGIGVSEKKKGCDASWQIWCKDPDGTDIEFHEYTAESSQITGSRCIVDW